MGVNQGHSAVDKDLKVHFMNKLYVRDLSMFPYSLMANLLLTLAALVIRLGDPLSLKPYMLGTLVTILASP